jgi:hypothetical protein
MKVGEKLTILPPKDDIAPSTDGVHGEVVYVMNVDDNTKYTLIRAGKTQVAIVKVDRVIKDLVKYR